MMKPILSLVFAYLTGFIFSLTSLNAVETPMDQKPVVAVETTQGTFEITLRPDIAPKAVENFLKHAESGYYNGIIFHRVIKDFMIQGGDPTGTGRGGESIWKKPFEDEFSSQATFSRPGLLAMANAGPRTNGSQFFITTISTPWLNNKHTIFGEVTKGYDIVQKIEKTKVGPGDRPVEEQKIIRMTVLNSGNPQ